MFRQSPGRNQRPKGIKAKHVLQICFLLVICFWLLYQVKHSHDKRKEFDESDAKISMRTQSSDEVLELGRKDLHPKVEETAITNRKQDEEAEEESVGEEEENKHEEEQQQQDLKFEEKEDEGKGVAEDELDEHEQEKSDAEVDREEEVTEEERDKEEGDEKESEENDPEDNSVPLENESSLEDHDNDDGAAENTHEAREEHYKADDASSAVTQETLIVSDENENEDSENSNKLPEMNKPANESQVDNTEKYSVGENTTDSKTEEREMLENSSPLNTTANEAVENVASKSEDSSLSSNSTLVEQSKDHPLPVKNTTEVITGPDGSSMQNATETQSNIDRTENVAAEGTTSGEGSDLQNISLDKGDKSTSGSSIHGADSTLATSVKTGETNPSSEENSKTDNSTVSIAPEKSMNSSIITEDNSESSITESNNATRSEKLQTDDGTGGMEHDALKTKNPDEVPNDPIDSSDSSITLEKNVRIAPDTLPEIQNEATNNEDAAAE